MLNCSDFDVGKCKQFSKTPYSRELQREKKNIFKKAGVGHIFLVHSWCTITQLKIWILHHKQWQLQKQY
jgi:hypothetical protein